ncbi:MAG: sce7726 family protein [Candidatus Obscuribacterales bacterium]|nr:sce7726 family protein [Candidatus Obscuribacterales bacterium]
MNEAQIKAALYQSELARLCMQDPSTRVVEEFCILGGKVRVDVSAINGQLHGYEIKSAADNLDRLPRQQKYYNKIFDRITLVADEKHVVHAVKIVPPFWGLIAARSTADGVVLNEIWPARQNFDVDANALVQLLWRDEVLSVLRVNGIGRGLSQKSRKYLWKVMTSKLELPIIQSSVRNCLKYRIDWR